MTAADVVQEYMRDHGEGETAFRVECGWNDQSYFVNNVILKAAPEKLIRRLLDWSAERSDTDIRSVSYFKDMGGFHASQILTIHPDQKDKS